jgi:hypothetical protein
MKIVYGIKMAAESIHVLKLMLHIIQMNCVINFIKDVSQHKQVVQHLPYKDVKHFKEQK